MITRKLVLFTVLFLGIVTAYLCSCGDDKSTGSGGISTGDSTEAITAGHEAVDIFNSIPTSLIEGVGQQLNFYYAHTSHGSQIMTGLDMIENEDSTYVQPYFFEYGDDLGHSGDTSWISHLRSYLNGHSECNAAMLSWCGGVSDNTEEGINIYLNAMNGLEQDYPGVVFIYMTGHLDGTGDDGNLRARNNQIRDFCIDNQKILFDFADIESHDPDGIFYPDENDGCNWCYDWCTEYDCLACASCAHSHCFNCHLKGKAFWWLMARIIGWEN